MKVSSKDMKFEDKDRLNFMRKSHNRIKPSKKQYNRSKNKNEIRRIRNENS